jgi:hypothetical protein
MTQLKLGADLILVLDKCAPFPGSKQNTEYFVERSNRWALPSFQRFSQNHDFGQAIGGSLGCDRTQIHETVATACHYIREVVLPISWDLVEFPTFGMALRTGLIPSIASIQHDSHDTDAL